MTFEEGQKVEARFKGGAAYYGGTVMKVNGDGSYNILYDHGDNEKSVPEALLRGSGGGGGSSSGSGGGGSGGGSKSPLSSGAAAVSSAEKFDAGQKVEARFGGKSRFYPGTITKSNGDGTYEVLYDDGDSEKKVDASLIKAAAGSSSSSGSGGGGGSSG